MDQRLTWGDLSSRLDAHLGRHAVMTIRTREHETEIAGAFGVLRSQRQAVIVAGEDPDDYLGSDSPAYVLGDA